MSEQLAKVPLEQVGVRNFKQCEKHLSPACSMEFTYVECLFQCSPNVYPWFAASSGALESIPICSWFCDRWFLTCQNDLTCALGDGNWNVGLPRNNTVEACHAGATCRNYTEVYRNGERMCNSILGKMFRYTTDDDNCLDPTDPEHNARVVDNLGKGYTTDVCPEPGYVDAGLVVGIVFGVIAALFLIAVGAYFFLKSRNDEGAGKKAKEVASPQELSSMAPPQNSPNTPPNTRDGSDLDEP